MKNNSNVGFREDLFGNQRSPRHVSPSSVSSLRCEGGNSPASRTGSLLDEVDFGSQDNRICNNNNDDGDVDGVNVDLEHQERLQNREDEFVMAHSCADDMGA